MVVEYTSNTSDVRELSKSVLVSTFPDSEIVKEQKAAYNKIAIFTHKFDWVSTDPEYPTIQKMEAQLAKVFIFEHFAGVRYANEIKMWKDEIYETLQDIKDNMITVPTDEEEIITSTDYKSWNLNPDLPFMSKLDPSLRNDSIGLSD